MPEAPFNRILGDLYVHAYESRAVPSMQGAFMSMVLCIVRVPQAPFTKHP